jgi:diacylglycerol kinase (ATP)
MPPPRTLLILNPRTCTGPRARVARAALSALRESAHVAAELETRGDAEDAQRIVEAIEKEHAEVIVVAGGDGTVGLVIRAMLRASGGADAALGLLPLGTGNNAARSFGLRSLRREGDGAAALAVDAIVRGERRALDVGTVNGAAFIGSFALGFDADTLARRNRLRRRLGRAGLHTDYGLYVASVALGLLVSRRPWRARVLLDRASEPGPFFNVVVVNTPVYAGPLRFDGANDFTDGRLDVHAVASAREYVSEYPRAWIRYLRALRGETVTPSPRLRRAREITLEPETPVAAQIDGEEVPPASAYRVSVLPRAVRVCVPPVTTRGG